MLNRINRYRDFLMGFSILWVVFFHTNIVTSSTLLNFIRFIGYGGVDIFIFLSGYGLYHSLVKDENLSNYLKKRAARILLPYYIFIIIYFITYSIGDVKTFTIQEIAGNIFLHGFWLGVPNQFNWYVQALPLFYLLAPFLVKAIKTSKNSNITSFCLVGIALIFSLTYQGQLLLIIMARIPVFILGMWLGKRSCEQKSIKKREQIIWYALMCVGIIVLYLLTTQHQNLLYTYDLWWYPFLLIVIGLCFLISSAIHYLNRIKVFDFVEKSISKIGRCSFEIYLIHIAFFEYVPLKTNHEMSIFKQLFLGAVAILMGVLYNIFIQKIVTCKCGLLKKQIHEKN